VTNKKKNKERVGPKGERGGVYTDRDT